MVRRAEFILLLQKKKHLKNNIVRLKNLFLVKAIFKFFFMENFLVKKNEANLFRL